MLGKKKEEKPQWDPEFEPVMKLLLGKKGIKTKSASEVGKKKVDYFRGKDFKKFLLENPQKLKKKCQPALTAALGSNGDAPETDKDIEALGHELIARNFIFKAAYKPINPSSKDTGSGPPMKKWPDRLTRMNNQHFDVEGFYVITYEGGGSMQHFMLACIISGVLLACMFPVWPLWAKVGIWYLSVIFLSLYFGILILRMIVYTLFWIVGFDFWIFPNINDEYCGFLDSFKPVYSWDKRKDDALMLLIRFGSLAMTAMAVKSIAETHSLADVQDFVSNSYTDLLDWGVEKLTALPAVERQALPSMEELKNQTLGDDHDDDDDDDDLKASDPKATGEEEDVNLD